jgi:hypothetical protein
MKLATTLNMNIDRIPKQALKYSINQKGEEIGCPNKRLRGQLHLCG